MFRRFKEKYIGDRDFYHRLFFLALPMIIQNGITNFVSLLDNIMVGKIGTEQMAGVAIVNQLLFVYYICIFGGVSGAGIFGAQFYGKGDYEGQKYAFRFKMYISIAIALLACTLFVFGGTTLISLYLSESSEVGDITVALKYAKDYLQIMLLSLIPFAISQAYVSTIRETGQTFVPMLSSAVAVGTNLILDLILIFGFGPIPAFGVSGAAMATVIARFVECLIVVIWTHSTKERNPYIIGAYKGFGIPKQISKGIIIKGTPLLINEMLWASGMAAITQCYSVRGMDVVAALNISSTITNMFNIVFIQMGGCISIIVGQHLGAGRLEEAKDADTKMIFISVVCCVVVAAVMALVGRYFPALYNTEDSIKAMASTFILIAALAMPLCAFSHCAYFTLRSGGKTIVTFLFDSAYTWALVVPCAFLLAHFTSLPIATVFFLVQFTELFKATIGFFMVKSNVWLQNIVDI